jgi:hypothetical protein
MVVRAFIGIINCGYHAISRAPQRAALLWHPPTSQSAVRPTAFGVPTWTSSPDIAILVAAKAEYAALH